MERISLPDLKNSMKPPAISSGDLERRKVMEKQFLRMAISAKNPAPTADRLDLLLEDAYRLWKSIPTEKIPEAVDLAIIEAGSFEATAGLVAKCWREREGKEIHLGDGCRMSIDETRNYLERLNRPEELPPPEFVDGFFRGIIGNLEGQE